MSKKAPVPFYVQNGHPSASALHHVRTTLQSSAIILHHVQSAWINAYVNINEMMHRSVDSEFA